MPHIQLPALLVPSTRKKKNVPVSPIQTGEAGTISGLKPLIEMQDIYKAYKTHAGDFTALKGVSASFYPGQFVSIIGKSGSGKSTLLNMVTGIDRPTSGKILIGETYLQDLSESKFSEWRGRNLGIVFQFFQLLPMLTLLENTILPMDFCQMYTTPEREIRARKLLQMVGLEDFSDKLPSAVSGGQEQCAAIARALANDPPIIVADEPTGNLDSRTAEMVLQLIDELVKQGKTVLVVTHDEAVAQRASRTLVICDGELVDEDISRMLPTISHRSMLKLSHQAFELTKQLGNNIFADSSELPGLLLLLDGQITIRSANERKVAAFQPGSILTGDFIKKTLESGRIFSASSTSPVRIKLVSQEDLQSTLNTSKSLQAFLQKLDLGKPGEKSQVVERSVKR
jgi:putative ABC transport system ATP-binding protein